MRSCKREFSATSIIKLDFKIDERGERVRGQKCLGHFNLYEPEYLQKDREHQINNN